MNKEAQYDKALESIQGLIDKIRKQVDITNLSLTNNEIEVLKNVPKSVLDIVNKELLKYTTDSPFDIRKQYVYKMMAVIFTNIKPILIAINTGYETGKELYA